MFSSLRGTFSSFPLGMSESDLICFAQFTDDVGIQSFLRHRLKESGALATCPDVLQQAFQRRYLMEVITHSLRKQELRRVIEAFHMAQVRLLILKGAALSYLIYPEPHHRICCDIDVFVDPGKVSDADLVLRSLGYEQIDRHNFEITYRREDQGVEHLLDVHWKLSDSPVLSVMFDFEEIYERSIPIPALSQWAHTLDAVDSLINACIHMAHHQRWDRLIWLTDVYLLHDRLSDAQFDDFVARAINKRCVSVCLEALRMTRNVYGIELNHPAIKHLIDQESNGFRKSEPSDYLLKPDADWIYVYLYMIRVSPWGEKFKLIRKALFPPQSALSERYDTRSKFKLPFNYLYRTMIRLPISLMRTGRFMLKRRRKNG